MLFQTRIADLLREHGLKQADLCRKTKIPTSLMSNYVRGKVSPTLDNAIAIADALDVTLDELVGRQKECKTTCKNGAEEQLLEKFRFLDERGKRNVLRNLNAEYEDVSKNLVEVLSSAVGA